MTASRSTGELPAKGTVPAELKVLSLYVSRLRNAHGFDSPIGHTCSNLIKQIPLIATYQRPAWATDVRQTLPWMIQQQVKRLAALTAQAH